MQKYPELLGGKVSDSVKVTIKVYTKGVRNMDELRRFVPRPEFEAEVWKWLNANKNLGVNLGSHYEELPEEFYKQFFPDVDWSQWFVWSEGDTPDADPYVPIKRGDGWVVVQFSEPQFGFRESADTEYEVIRLPDCYRMDEHWTIYGDRIVFHSNYQPWPYPVLHPGRYDVWGRLNYLLDPTEESPITILMRSPQPYRGLGRQVIQLLKELKEISSRNSDV